MSESTRMKPGYDWRNPPSDPRLDRVNWPELVSVDGNIVSQAEATPDQLARAQHLGIGMIYDPTVGFAADPMYNVAVGNWVAVHPDPVKAPEPEPVLFDATASTQRIEKKVDAILAHLGIKAAV